MIYLNKVEGKHMEVIFKSTEENDIAETIAKCFAEKNDYEYAKKVYLETRNNSPQIGSILITKKKLNNY